MRDGVQDHVIICPARMKGGGLVVCAFPVRWLLIAVAGVRSVGLVSSALGSGGIIGPLDPTLGKPVTLKEGTGGTHI